MSQKLALEFRKSNLLIEDANRLQTEHEQKIKELEISLNEFDSLNGEIKSLGFEDSNGFQDDSFGIVKLSLSNRFIAFSCKKIISK